MADMENKYYQVAKDDADSQSAPIGRRLKVGLAIALGGLALVAIAAQSASGPTEAETSATNLMGWAPSLRSSAALGMGKIINPSMLPGSGPYKNAAIALLQANSLGKQASLSNMDPATKAVVVKAEQEVVAKAESFGVTDVKSMPGVTAPLGFFDPVGFSTDTSQGRLLFFREVEIKHGRVGMLAALGFVVGENFHPLFGGDIDVPSYLAFQQTPLQVFWPAVLFALAILEAPLIGAFQPQDKADSEQFAMKLDRMPGDLGFDPLGLKPKDAKGLLEMQNKELNNGRLAMLAAAGMIAQELVTGKKLFDPTAAIGGR